MRSALWTAVAAFLAMAVPAAACGTDSDCPLGDRSYRIYLPDGLSEASGAPGAILYAHGYRGTAAGAMRNAGLRALADELGVALIAAQAGREDWDIPGTPAKPEADGTAELAYFDAVVADATARFGLDPARIMATGFSAGGMMVWNLICERSRLFAAFAPVAGTFWQPEPEGCSAPPAHVIHIHGDADRIVPLEGRAIGPTRQGVVPRVLEMYADHGGYAARGTQTRGELDCRLSRNDAGRILEFCLFEGGHSFRISHLRTAWERFEAVGAL